MQERVSSGVRRSATAALANACGVAKGTICGGARQTLRAHVKGYAQWRFRGNVSGALRGCAWGWLANLFVSFWCVKGLASPLQYVPRQVAIEPEVSWSEVQVAHSRVLRVAGQLDGSALTENVSLSRFSFWVDIKLHVRISRVVVGVQMADVFQVS
jgi:hypothetical protein